MFCNWIQTVVTHSCIHELDSHTEIIYDAQIVQHIHCVYVHVYVPRMYIVEFPFKQLIMGDFNIDTICMIIIMTLQCRKCLKLNDTGIFFANL